jgi:hypothetical protein
VGRGADASTIGFVVMSKKFVPIENLKGVERLVALSLIQEMTPGTASVISEVLRNLAAMLERGEHLHPGEAKYLANALRSVAANPNKHGQPFGFQKRTGRPGSLNPLHRMAVGKLVDELHRPTRYELDAAPVALNDNSNVEGAYSRVAEETGCSVKTVERAHKEYIRFLNR